MGVHRASCRVMSIGGAYSIGESARAPLYATCPLVQGTSSYHALLPFSASPLDRCRLLLPRKKRRQPIDREQLQKREWAVEWSQASENLR
jgi:hypothetical protein